MEPVAATRERGGPGQAIDPGDPRIPAFAGMTADGPIGGGQSVTHA
jgi:hypothetical protein